MRIVLLGAPGAGKGTQAKFISAYFHIPRISTGDMLRQAIQSKSELGRQVEKAMAQGILAPDDLIIALVEKRMAESDCKNGFLLDGFPRTMPQAQALEKLGVPISHVIEIYVDDQEIIRRLSGRRFHPASGRTYHIDYLPPKEKDKDDITHEALIQREDDQEETLKKRLSVYHGLTQPLIKYYSNNSNKRLLSFKKVLGKGEINTVWKNILNALSQPKASIEKRGDHLC